MTGGKSPTEDWQQCPSCSTWWPVDLEFLNVDIDVECPCCHKTMAYCPAPRDVDLSVSQREAKP